MLFAKNEEIESERSNSPLDTIGTSLVQIWREKSCSYYTANERGVPVVSVACTGNYTDTEREKWLHTLFSHKYFLKSEKYRLQPGSGIYVYKTEYPEGSGALVYFKLYIRNATALYPRMPASGNQVAIYVQDLAELQDLIRWQTLGIPLTYGIIPAKKESQVLLQKVIEYGQEPWISLPLEPKVADATDGRTLSIQETRNPEEFESFLKEYLEDTEKIKGVSHRLGSLYTTNVFAMRALLEKLRSDEKKVIRYLDSTAYQDSVAFDTAKIMSFQAYKASANQIVDREKFNAFWNHLSTDSVQRTHILVVSASDVEFFETLKRHVRKKRSKRKAPIQFLRVSDLPFND